MSEERKLMTPEEWAALSADSRAAINRYGVEYESMKERIAELEQEEICLMKTIEIMQGRIDTQKLFVEHHIQNERSLYQKIADLETRLATVCHIEADDKAGFDWAVLDRIHELEATVKRLRNCHNCANNPGDTPCEYVYNCNDSSHWRPLPQPPEVSE